MFFFKDSEAKSARYSVCTWVLVACLVLITIFLVSFTVWSLGSYKMRRWNYSYIKTSSNVALCTLVLIVYSDIGNSCTIVRKPVLKSKHTPTQSPPGKMTSSTSSSSSTSQRVTDEEEKQRASTTIITTTVAFSTRMTGERRTRRRRRHAEKRHHS